MTPSSPSKDPNAECDSQPAVLRDFPNQVNSAPSKPTAPATRESNTVRRKTVRMVGFFGLLIFLIYALNTMINVGLRRIQTGQFGVSNWIVAGKINADIIITGSSRAVSHYDPRIIESVTGLTAFNIGLNGSQTDMQLAVLKTYLRHNRKPKIVFHNLDAFSFVMTTEVYDPAQYMPYLGEPDIYAALHIINPVLWWKCKYMPLYGYAVDDMRLDWLQGPLGLLGWSPRSDFFQGFNPRAGQWTEDFTSFKGANPDGVRFDIQPAGVKVMQDLIQTCHDNGITLIFVYSPEYAPMQFLTQNRAAIFGKFRELAQPYNVPLWDFSHWNEAGNTAFFVNSQHLNAEGAKIFSTDLAQRLADELPQLKTNVSTPSHPSRRVVSTNQGAF
jgi:hypothetical protein